MMVKRYRNVCELVVRNDLCIGCGVCAGICPANVLEMRFNNYGEYVPVEISVGCLDKCSVCLNACPFGNHDVDENVLAEAVFGSVRGAQYHHTTGYYLRSYVGYSAKGGLREAGSSGGLGRWLLGALLRRNVVNRVAAVIPCSEPDRLFRFAILNDTESVYKVSKSAYYPVEMSQAIKEVLSNDAHYAFVGLPCFLKSLRLAMRANRRLRDRIRVLVGLTCGKTRSKFWAEYLCARAGSNPKSMMSADFRHKTSTRPANDYGFVAECAAGSRVTKTREVFFSEVADMWTVGLFAPNACHHCDDIFAEVADVVIMDAWLPEYSQVDHLGNNIVLCRSVEAEQLVAEGIRDGELMLRSIALEDVLKSQAGIVDLKRRVLAQHLHMTATDCREYHVRKRVVPRQELEPTERLLLRLQDRVRRRGREAFFRRRSVASVRSAVMIEMALIRSIKLLVRRFESVRHRIAAYTFKTNSDGSAGEDQ